ncbi:hypothetical protein [Streptomyces aurantiogriseus]|uniref:Uncharacterized protein n=1 Tax=Streptomyces aurantiogriseus TaxID=66870 RepID=A0A918FFT7_9ACTN|nr:hypothetical protein [Streptomyces aurantiogriseus]GGR35320.1 hypothetical protein GCM10010251_59530 [Streptomyces aurantiogriseus]
MERDEEPQGPSRTSLTSGVEWMPNWTVSPGTVLPRRASADVGPCDEVSSVAKTSPVVRVCAGPRASIGAVAP